MGNNGTLIAYLFNPKYGEGIFKQLHVQINQSKEIIDVLNVEIALIISKTTSVNQSDLQGTAPQDFSNDSIGDLLSHLNLPAIKTSYATPNSQGDELICYLQNLHPMTKVCVERVFSHSGRLKTPTRAALGSRTIAHLTCLKEWLNEETSPH
ncbi:hypothetical protein O181_004792 [Austropuccinia psidii MF-1]|uniref:HAT C-terminal dimerisation domain-containing protein n=1 Tax=Austropuccinia psidii MF-1 TaxID=1389203 RepID=A0A9Q3BHJ6_9BASI|nr:hypothetical protein [Austropuccinia psidii MF-1]